MKLSNILVPTDFSPCADNALKAGIHLSKRTGASLIVFHAIEAAVYNEAAEAFYDVENEGISSQDSYEAMKKRIPELNEVDHEYNSNPGSVIDEISSMVKSMNIGLVVMGTMGVSGINEVLIGSNTYHVMRSLDVPVLVIPQLSRIDEVKNIALAGDYKPIDPELLEPVKIFADLNGADIHIVHISDDAELENAETIEARKINRHLKNYVHHYHLIIEEDIEKGLQKYCNDNHIDVLAMIPRKHNLFDRIFDGGETKNMVYHTQVPLLTIPENLK